MFLNAWKRAYLPLIRKHRAIGQRLFHNHTALLPASLLRARPEESSRLMTTAAATFCVLTVAASGQALSKHVADDDGSLSLWKEHLRLLLPSSRNENKGETLLEDDVSAINATTAYFPTLEAHLVVHDADYDEHSSSSSSSKEHKTRLQRIALNTPAVLHNEHFHGTVQLNLQPLEPAHDPTFCHETDPRFSIQVKGRLLKGQNLSPTTTISPLNHWYMGAQIAVPMTMEQTLGQWGKQLCRLLLQMLSVKIGGDMRYSFGTTNELPHISFPLTAAMEMIRHNNDDGSHDTDDDDYCTMTFSAQSIDLAAWKAIRPFEVPLERLWGHGTPIQLIIYHQPDDSAGAPRTYLLRLQLTPKQPQPASATSSLVATAATTAM